MIIKKKIVLCVCLTGFLFSSESQAELPGQFNLEKDLFIPQFDSKTDVDDLHSVAAVATVLASPELQGVRYHAVAGAYGIQEGLYVPAPELFETAFGIHWSNAHLDREGALTRVTESALDVLRAGGKVWVAEAGQSDFTADWLTRLDESGADTARVIVVQHSEWNESVTHPDKLARVKALASYERIADGNFPDNGTPNFNTSSAAAWPVAEDHEGTGEAWKLARDIGNQYNGLEGRYFNPSIDAGGLDFSDAVETCWIFGCADLDDVEAFFERF